jgi:PHP family Zn ribbon phosphoesterase
MYLADFHIHSHFSDGSMSIPEIVDFYGERGFGAIAITDHLCEEKSNLGKAAAYLGKTLTRATFPLYQEILKSERERAWREYQMLLIPGFEVTKNSLVNHRAAHVVALGATEWVSADQDLKQIARSIRNAGGLAVAAHPLAPHRVKNRPYYLWDQRRELENEFDAWEVASGPHLFPEVLASGLPMIATSDFHRPEQINAYKTLIESERHPEAILEAIRRQKVSFRFYQEDGIYDLGHDSPRNDMERIALSDDLRDFPYAEEAQDESQVVGG